MDNISPPSFFTPLFPHPIGFHSANTTCTWLFWKQIFMKSLTKKIYSLASPVIILQATASTYWKWENKVTVWAMVTIDEPH